MVDSGLIPVELGRSWANSAMPALADFGPSFADLGGEFGRFRGSSPRCSSEVVGRDSKKAHPERRRSEADLKELDARDKLMAAGYDLHALRGTSCEPQRGP